MKEIEFCKYQGAGNDFVMIDNRLGVLTGNESTVIRNLCERRFGIGADGLILLEEIEDEGLRMVYFNANGFEGSMCGNGGRCFVKFAHSLGYNDLDLNFLACDGWHTGSMKADGEIHLKMNDVEGFQRDGEDYVLDTGSPHYVRVMEDMSDLDPHAMGASIRHSEKYRAKGINVNFLQPIDALSGFVKTYERGVEAMTLACGTGVTACAIVMSEIHGQLDGYHSFMHQTEGGLLRVNFHRKGCDFTDIWLCGPAEESFRGSFRIAASAGERAPGLDEDARSVT